MCPGLADDLEKISDSRKTAVINCELGRLNIDVAALQETRLPEDGTVREKDYTFFWKGKPPEEARIHGVGFAIKNSLLHTIVPPVGGTERILSITMSTASGKVHLFSVYAPTLCSSQETKDRFYEDLSDIISKIPTSEHVILLGDFNARVGSEWNIWPDALGHFGIGKTNENGQRLLEMCAYYKLSITNTYFKTKPQHRVSWRHPRSGHWHQLDLIITRRKDLNSVLLTRSYHSADCDTDHTLVCCKMRLKPQKVYSTQKKGKARLDLTRTVNPNLCAELTKSLEGSLKNYTANGIEESWSFIRDAIYNSALSVLGKKKKKNTDWFDANLPEMTTSIEAKREALVTYKNDPTQENLSRLRTCRNNSQKLARKCANNFWKDLCQDIQACADSGNIKGMYEGIKKAYGPTINRVAPLKAKDGTIIQDRAAQMERWAEYYEDLYQTENIVSPSVLASIPTLTEMEDLDVPPTQNELSLAIDMLARGKAPGNDCIPAEVLQAGKAALLEPLHSLLCRCWEEGTVPQDLRDANIVTLYKNKGDRSDCNSYRGISLLSIVGKAYARIILKRLQILAERVYPESQCGFRTGRSTTDMIFSLRQLQEKCREQRQPLYIAFIDLTKAFDLVSRSGLFALLEKIGCPPKLLKMVTSFHNDMQGTVQFDNSVSKPFPIKSGVKQGCVLAPTLFGIFFSVLLNHAFGSSNEGIYIHTRSDGKLFNLARLKAKTKVRKVLIREMLFADDAALTAHSQVQLQILVTALADACRDFGLTISLNKTEIMGQDVTQIPP